MTTRGHSTPGTSWFDPLIHSTPARIRRTRITRFELVHEQPGPLDNAMLSLLRRRGLPMLPFGSGPDLRRLDHVRRWDDVASGTTWFEWVPL